MKSHNIAFGRVLRDLRKQQSLSQEELAFAADRDRTYISLLELGQRSPTLDTILALCHALNVPLVQLAAAVQAKMENHE